MKQTKTPALLDRINNMVDAYCHGEKLSREGIGDVEEITVAILNCVCMGGGRSRRGSLTK